MKVSEIAARVKQLVTENPKIVWFDCNFSYVRGPSVPGYEGSLVGVAIQQLYPKRIKELIECDWKAYTFKQLMDEMKIENDSDAALEFIIMLEDDDDAIKPNSKDCMDVIVTKVEAEYTRKENEKKGKR